MYGDGRAFAAGPFPAFAPSSPPPTVADAAVAAAAAALTDFPFPAVAFFAAFGFFAGRGGGADVDGAGEGRVPAPGRRMPPKEVAAEEDGRAAGLGAGERVEVGGRMLGREDEGRRGVVRPLSLAEAERAGEPAGRGRGRGGRPPGRAGRTKGRPGRREGVG